MRRWVAATGTGENCTRFWGNDAFIFTLHHGCSVPSMLVIVYSGAIAFASVCLIVYCAKSMMSCRAEYEEKLRASIEPAYANEIANSIRCCDLFRSIRFSLFAQTIAFAILFTGYAVTTSLLPFAPDLTADASAMHALQSVILFVYYASLLRVSQMTNIKATNEGETKTPTQRLTMTFVIPAVVMGGVMYIGVATGMAFDTTRYVFAIHIVIEWIYVLGVVNDMHELGKTLQGRRVSLGIPLDSTNDVGERMMSLASTCGVMHSIRTVALLGILMNAYSPNVGESTAVVGLEIISQCELLAELFYVVVRLPKR